LATIVVQSLNLDIKQHLYLVQIVKHINNQLIDVVIIIKIMITIKMDRYDGYDMIFGHVARDITIPVSR